MFQLLVWRLQTLVYIATESNGLIFLFKVQQKRNGPFFHKATKINGSISVLKIKLNNKDNSKLLIWSVSLD